MYFLIFVIGLGFPGIFLYLQLEDIATGEKALFLLYLASIVVSGLFWYGVYKANFCNRFLEIFLALAMNLIETGYYKGDSLFPPWQKRK